MPQAATSRALIPTLLARTPALQDQVTSVSTNALAVLTATMFVSVMAQIAIPLPFTPVPITGQTLGVLLTSLTLGRNRAVAAIALYLTLGAIGLPVFAGGKAGLVFGPTVGYLVGMLLSSYVVGSLADRGFTRSVPRSIAACLCASVITFGCGVAALSAFLPLNELLMAGVLPFIPGDIVKMSIAIALVRPAHKLLKV